MMLSELIKHTEVIKVKNFKDFEVKELSLSSKEVFKDSLFFAVNGNNYNGVEFLSEAISRGAKAVVLQEEIDNDVCQIIVKDVYRAVSELSYEFYKPKSKRVKVIGVVGTNGKTTITYILKSILEKAGIKCGVIGTLGIYYDTCKIEPTLTTPDAIFLSEILLDMANRKVEYAIMELSAHAITQKRANAIKFEALVFTNCTRDHLDYYSSFEKYEETKLSVFNSDVARFAVVNADDKTGIKILNGNKIKTYSYGLNNPSDVFAINVKSTAHGVSFIMNLFDDVTTVNYLGVGNFNVYNCLASATVASVIGINHNAIVKGISSLCGVRGRMEFVENYMGADVFVDYAHTPDGLENTLKSAREITDGRLIVLFGCGGNRDKGKRSVMGKIAGEYADFSIITSDNPRFEEPFEIIDEIENGIREVSLKYITIQNRKMAIDYALSILSLGDVLIVAGKGAEKYQEIMGVKHPFNDIEEIRDGIAKLKFGGEII